MTHGKSSSENSASRGRGGTNVSSAAGEPRAAHDHHDVDACEPAYQGGYNNRGHLGRGWCRIIHPEQLRRAKPG